jgi:hypothetical protein
MNKKITPGLILVISLLLLGGLARFFTPLPNFTPIAAIALFAGAYLRKKKLALLLPIIILAVTDAIIGNYDFITMSAVYVSFVLTGLIGLFVGKKIKVLTVAGGAIASSLLFFLITNFGTWLSGFCGYPMTFGGLAICYEMAIPFFRNEILSTLVYSGVLFGIFELVKLKKPIFAQI